VTASSAWRALHRKACQRRGAFRAWATTESPGQGADVRARSCMFLPVTTGQRQESPILLATLAERKLAALLALKLYTLRAER
jgi:hypothetical protein